MITQKKIFLPIVCFLLCLLLCGCRNGDKTNNSNTNNQTTEKDYSYKTQMDMAMKHISNPKVLATVNDVNITQVDIDLYSVDGEKHDTSEIVRYYIITDYAEKNSLKMDTWCQDLYNSIEDDMLKDKELSDDYCLTTYGISKSEVIRYAKKRIYQIGMESAFSNMVTTEVTNGETPKKHPKLKKAYEKFQKNKLNKGSKAWDEIEQAYYEMIAEDYDVVIY